MVVVDTVDALLMGIFERKVWGRRAKGPNLDGVIETGRGEDLRIFRVLKIAKQANQRRFRMQEQSESQTYDGKRHDVMIVTSVLLSTPPCLFPIPAFDSAIVRSGQDDG